MQTIARPRYEHRVLDWLADVSSRVLCVHGAPGVGKSTIVRQALGEADGIEWTIGLQASQWLDVLGRAERVVPDVFVIDEVKAGQIAAVWRMVEQLRVRYPSVRFVLVGTGLMQHVAAKADAALRVRGIAVYGLNFDEYLCLMGRTKLAQYLTHDVMREALSPSVHRLLLREWYAFVAVGGLPAIAAGYRDGANVEELQRHYVKDVLTETLRVLRHKTATEHLVQALQAVHDQAGEKFVLSHAIEGYRAFQAKKVMDVLEDLGLVLRCTHTDVFEGDVALKTNEKFLRYMFFDTGILRAWSAGRVHLSEQPLRSESVHRYVDAFVAKELAVAQMGQLYWWRREKTGSDAAVEFVAATQPPLPVTLQPNKGMHLQALRLMMADKSLETAVRLDQECVSTKDGVQTVPVYAIGARIEAVLRS